MFDHATAGASAARHNCTAQRLKVGRMMLAVPTGARSTKADLTWGKIRHVQTHLIF